MKFGKFIPILKVVFVIFLGVIIINMLFSNKTVEGAEFNRCLGLELNECKKGDNAKYCVKKRRVYKYKDGSVRKIDEWCDNKND